MQLAKQDLNLTIHPSTFVKIGHVEGSEQIQSFFEAVSSFINFPLDEEAKQYLSNSIFIPRIIAKMITDDIPFSEALTQSKDYFAGDAEIFKIDLSALEPITLLSTLKAAKKWSEKLNDCAFVNITVKNVSEKIASIIENMGLISVAEEIATTPKIRELLKGIYSPIVEGVISSLKTLCDDEDDEELEKLHEKLVSSLNDSLEFIVLQEILSAVVRKAIDEDITIVESKAQFDTPSLTDSVIESLNLCASFSDDLREFSGDIIGLAL